MNHNPSTTVFLINTTVRAVRASYAEADDYGARAGTPKLFKTFDKNLKVGDIAIVPTKTRHGFTVVKITEVDVFPDMSTQEEVLWIVQTINKTNYETLLAQEAEAVKEVNEAQMRAQREELAANLFKNNQERLKALPLAKQELN